LYAVNLLASQKHAGFEDHVYIRLICMKEDIQNGSDMIIKKPPVGLAAIALVGPSLVWAAEYIGSGEVVIATRTGAILGTAVLWAVVVGVFLKFWIGVSGARYTVCTGEGMIDMFSRTPGPRNWAVWLVMVVQVVCAVLAIGTLAASAGAFIHSLIPCVDMKLCGWFAALFAFAVAWSGVFSVLKIVMSIFVLIIVLGAFYITAHVLPGFAELLKGFTFSIPSVPEWAVGVEEVSDSAWEEILPVLGWGAGGFASQVWYTYWVIGAGYGATAGRGYGRAADVASPAANEPRCSRQNKRLVPCYVCGFRFGNVAGDCGDSSVSDIRGWDTWSRKDCAE